MNRLTTAVGLLASLLLAACGSEHSKFPTDHCLDNCVTGDETLVVAPARSLLLVGSEHQFAATLVTADGSRQDVTDVVDWRSDNSALATVSSSGMVSGVAPGITAVTARLPALEARADVAVSNLGIERLVVSPAYRRLLPGLPQQYTATAVLTDGSTVDVTTHVDWSVGNPAVASIDPDGLAHALAEGVTSIDAHYVQGATDLSAAATLAVRPPIVTIESFYIDPASATTIPGGRVPYRAFVVTSGNETLEVSGGVDWQSTNAAVAEIDSAGIATAHVAGDAGIQASFTYLGQPQLATAALKVVTPSLSELSISPQWAERVVGQQQAYRAMAVLAGGTTVDVTDRVLWQSQSPTIASVDQAGVASALSVGQATVTASLSIQGASHTDDGVLVVDSPPPVLQSLSVEPPNASVLVDDDLQYHCLASFSDGSVHDVTGQCLWAVADPATAVIDGLSGLLTGITAGSTQVEARWTYQGTSVVGTTAVEVIAPVTVVALQVTPASAESIVLGTQQFLAHALLSDGRKIDVTSNVAWTSADTSVAAVSAVGLARALKPGATQIRAAASYQGTDFADAATFTVTPPAVTIVEFRVIPPQRVGIVGRTAQFEAEVLLSNGKRVDVTRLARWIALDRTIARSTLRSGEFVGLRPGTTRVQADINFQGTSYSSSAGLRIVDPAALVRGLEIVPPSPLLLTGRQRQLHALLLLRTGDAIDVTDRALWSSADTAIATIDAQGLATGIAGGATQLTGNFVAGTISETDTVRARVLDPATQLVALRLSPRRASALIGVDTKFTATAYYLNGTRDDVSDAVSWTIADTSVAELVSQDGLVRAKAAGTTTVSARFNANGTVRIASATLEVTAPVITITEIQVTPARQAVASGNAAQFRATAILSDFSNVDITLVAQWRSSDPSIAQATRPEGAFITFQPGTVTVSASVSYQNQTVTGQAELVVEAAQPVFLEVSPPQLRLTIGGQAPLSAILHLSDNTTQEVTNEVSWQSRDRSIATVGAGLSRGVVTGVAPGSTSIDAVYRESLTASAAVQVTAPALLSIDVLPATSTLAAGMTHDFVAIGNYDDGSAPDITDRVLWMSSDESIAAIVGVPAGRVQGVMPGAATVSASLDGIVGSASLTVTPAIAVGLEVGPDPVRIRVDEEQAFVAVAILSDGGRRQVTDEVTWISSAPAIASVSNEPGSAGVAQGLSGGAAQITAILDGTLQDFATLQVIAPIVSSLVVTPANQSVSENSNVYYRATAVLSNGTQLDVTNLVRWTSSNPDIAAISNAQNKGTATALAPGTTTISALLDNLSGQTNLTVTGACQGNKPDSVFIVSDVTVHVGETAQMQVTGVFPGGCMQDLTEDSASVWDSDDKDVFTIGNKNGIVTGIGPGVASAAVKNRSNTDTATVTVTP